MRMLLSMFLCSTMVGMSVFAQGAPPVSNPQVAAEGDLINDSSALDDGNIQYVEPIFGVVQPGAFLVEWAPPALLVEDVGIAPSDAAFWAGGYWDWYDGQWCWARGRWIAPPQPGYSWNAPYYENRGGRVVYVGGYWRAPNATFSRPTSLPGLARTNASWHHGPRPLGASGTFVPAPPGSKPGLIVPAPMGTPPRVMASQPPLDKAGMAVRSANGRYEVHAPAGVVRGGERVDARVASMPVRTGEKGVRPQAIAETSKAPLRAPAKTTAPNLDPTHAAERTVERERPARTVAVSPKPTEEPRANGPREVPISPAAHGMSAMPHAEPRLRGENGPRNSVPVERGEHAVERGPLGPVERAPVERAPAGNIERGPIERAPVGHETMERGAVEPHAVEARPVAAPVAAHPMAAPPGGGGGEAHH